VTGLPVDIAKRYLQLAWSTLWPPAGGVARRTWRHYAVAVALLAGLPLLLVYHWIGLALDELLFRGYRSVTVHSPVFVLGVPRSGTTALHRALARDKRNFTTFTTWEALFGVSITWHRLWTAVARCDRRMGGPLGAGVRRIERGVFGAFRDSHPTALDAPEEDYLVLLPVLACFGLVLPFPDARCLWRLGRCDAAMARPERERLLRFYRRCLQRHLYIHGPDRRLLSKNAAFAPLARSLIAEFPDARVLCCVREPSHVVSSQLHSIRPALQALHGDYRREVLQRRMLSLLAFYQAHLLATLPERSGPRAVFVANAALRADLAATVVSACRLLDLPVGAAFAAELRAMAAASAEASRPASHGLAEHGIARSDVAAAFGDLRALTDAGAAVTRADRWPAPCSSAAAA